MTLVYALCMVSGVCLERRLPLNSVVQRVVMILTGAAAQLLLSIQALSLGMRLTGAGLIAANVGMTLLLLAAGRFWRPSPDRTPWSTLLGNARQTVRGQKREPLALALAAVAACAIVGHNTLGAFMIVNGDPYHFEMPLFWIQHATILPFPVGNPRVCALSFAAEGLCLPGFFYAHTPVAFAFLSALAAFLTLGLVFSLSRRLGSSVGAAACAAGLITGYTQYAVLFLTAQAAFFLAGMWAAASALFLLESRAYGEAGRPEPARLACSVACFAMACGVKNSSLLMAPAYLVALCILHRGTWLRPRLLAPLAVTGVLGFLSSGVAWNYVSNRLWYGDPGGPQLLHAALSRERGPREIWTRMSRGGVLMAFDTIWIPHSLQHGYVTLCRGIIKAAGASKDLAEDDEFYGFPDRSITPRGGLGLLGIGFFLPALVWGAIRFARRPLPGESAGQPGRRAGGVLVLLAVGVFVMCHAVMRWQSIGLLRLAPAFIILGAPLCAPLLERRWTKAVALGLLVVSTGMFFVFDLGLAARRWNVSQTSVLFKLISRFQQPHSLPVQYQWGNDPPQPMVLREDYSTHEVYEKLFERIQTNEVFGFVGDANSVCYYLFGKNFQNRVIPLVDARSPATIAEPPADARYVVFAEGDARAKDWAEARHFNPFFRIFKEDHCIFAVLKKDAPGN